MAGKPNEAKQGSYRLRFPHKYKGPLDENGDVHFRSSWESRLFFYMDHNANFVEWGSESITIPYLFSLDNKVHKYYPDIVCKAQLADGSLQTFILEVKPDSQTKMPSKPKNRSIDRKKRYEQEMYVYVKNQDKWKYTEEYCKKNNYVFLLVTENEIFGRNR